MISYGIPQKLSTDDMLSSEDQNQFEKVYMNVKYFISERF
jgi:hypothetical protein